jgi:hypothetical protein
MFTVLSRCRRSYAQCKRVILFYVILVTISTRYHIVGTSEVPGLACDTVIVRERDTLLGRSII